jgi:putative ABC transport system substrate-binding protein
MLLAALGTAALAAAPLCAQGQQPARIWRSGFLTLGNTAARGPGLTAYFKAMNELGYAEGKNLRMEYRSAQGRQGALADLAAELVRLNVDVIIADSELSARAAQAATRSIPIVMLSGAPVETGLVASLSRPGGNVTGVTNFSVELTGKRLELVKELIPGISRVAVLWDSGGPVPALAFRSTRDAAASLGMQVQSLEVQGSAPDLEGAFKAAADGRTRALITITNPLTVAHAARIVGLARQYRLPAVYAARSFVDAGGLISYGTSSTALFGRMAYYVDRIFRGSKPADLPLEQPAQFELVINRKAADEIGLAIPSGVLARADTVIR